MREAGLAVAEYFEYFDSGQAHPADVTASVTASLPKALWHPQGRVSEGFVPGTGFLHSTQVMNAK